MNENTIFNSPDPRLVIGSAAFITIGIQGFAVGNFKDMVRGLYADGLHAFIASFVSVVFGILLGWQYYKRLKKVNSNLYFVLSRLTYDFIKMWIIVVLLITFLALFRSTIGYAFWIANILLILLIYYTGKYLKSYYEAVNK